MVILGTFQAPSDAVGNADPRFISMSLEKVVLTLSDGTSVDASPTTPTSLRVLSRPQIAVEKDLADYVGKTISTVAIAFNATAVVGGKYTTEIPITLANPSPKYTGSLSIEKTKKIGLEVDVQWKNIITRDDTAATELVSSPTFATTVTSQ